MDIKKPNDIQVGIHVESKQAICDQRILHVASDIAGWSKNRKRKVGCVITNDRGDVVSTGCNGFPRGIDDNIEERHISPLKHLFVEHAERNAIYNAAAAGSAVRDCTLYSTLYPCAECAKAIIQSSIKRLVTYPPDWDDKRYKESFAVSKQMFDEVGIEITFYDVPQ
jgi:dCMP deaminase